MHVGICDTIDYATLCNTARTWALSYALSAKQECVHESAMKLSNAQGCAVLCDCLAAGYATIAVITHTGPSGGGRGRGPRRSCRRRCPPDHVIVPVDRLGHGHGRGGGEWGPPVRVGDCGACVGCSARP